MERDIAQRLLKLERWQEGLNLPEMGDGQPVFLDEPYTNTTFDGDSFSTVGAHTKIENTSWSTAIPSNAKALAVVIQARDSGSAAASAWFSCYSTATATNPALLLYLYGAPNDAVWAGAGLVPCTDGDIWYRCTATAADRLDVWLYVVGYWL